MQQRNAVQQTSADTLLLQYEQYTRQWKRTSFSHHIADNLMSWRQDDQSGSLQCTTRCTDCYYHNRHDIKAMYKTAMTALSTTATTVSLLNLKHNANSSKNFIAATTHAAALLMPAVTFAAVEYTEYDMDCCVKDSHDIAAMTTPRSHTYGCNLLHPTAIVRVAMRNSNTSASHSSSNECD
eukprot:811-Heterococcus_DN1.PRE.3